MMLLKYDKTLVLSVQEQNVDFVGDGRNTTYGNQERLDPPGDSSEQIRIWILLVQVQDDSCTMLCEPPRRELCHETAIASSLQPWDI
jgi:hypothetical protein